MPKVNFSNKKQKPLKYNKTPNSISKSAKTAFEQDDKKDFKKIMKILAKR